MQIGPITPVNYKNQSVQKNNAKPSFKELIIEPADLQKLKTFLFNKPELNNKPAIREAALRGFKRVINMITGVWSSTKINNRDIFITLKQSADTPEHFDIKACCKDDKNGAAGFGNVCFHGINNYVAGEDYGTKAGDTLDCELKEAISSLLANTHRE